MVCNDFQMEIHPQLVVNGYPEVKIIRDADGGSEGILGIGSKITDDDVGKVFVRLAPSGNDWELCVADHTDLKNIREYETLELVAINEHSFLFRDLTWNELKKDFDKDDLELSRFKWDDEHWIAYEEYEDFVTTYSLQFLGHDRFVSFDV